MKILVTLALALPLICYAAPPNEFEKIIKDYMETKLKDPDSARYQFLNTPAEGETDYLICAKINSKNSYGAYNGYHLTSFFISSGRVVKSNRGTGDVYGDLWVNNDCSAYIH